MRMGCTKCLVLDTKKTKHVLGKKNKHMRLKILIWDFLFGKIEGYLGIVGGFVLDQMNGNDLEMIKFHVGKFLKSQAVRF